MIRKDKGFTLIELLIVIVIIGILAGVLVTVIDPAGQQEKANQAALRANVEKGCLALNACGATSTSAKNCNTAADAGIRIPTAGMESPTNAVYGLSTSTTYTDVTAIPETVADGATIYYRGYLGTCGFQCAYNFTSGSPTYYSGTVLEVTGTTCRIGAK